MIGSASFGIGELQGLDGVGTDIEAGAGFRMIVARDALEANDLDAVKLRQLARHHATCDAGADDHDTHQAPPCSLRGDDRDQAAAVRPLMLGAARDEDPAVADHTGDKTGDRAADMALRVDVGIVKHGVAVAANVAAPVRLAFYQHAGDPRGIVRRDLR